MTVAVCFRCGAMKFGAFCPCGRCGVEPQTDDDRALSMLMTDHFYDRSELEQMGQDIRDGHPPQCAPELRDQLTAQMEEQRQLGIMTETLGVAGGPPAALPSPVSPKPVLLSRRERFLVVATATVASLACAGFFAICLAVNVHGFFQREISAQWAKEQYLQAVCAGICYALFAVGLPVFGVLYAVVVYQGFRGQQTGLMRLLLRELKGVGGLGRLKATGDRDLPRRLDRSLSEPARLIVQLPLTDRLGTEAEQQAYRAFAQAVQERLPGELGQFGGLFIGRGVWNLNVMQVAPARLGEAVAFLVAGLRRLGIGERAVVIRRDEPGGGPPVFTPVWPEGYRGRFFTY